MLRIAFILAVLLGWAAVPAAAQTLAGEHQVVILKPGEFVWFDDPALQRVSVQPGEGISILISIPAQLAYVYRDGILIAVSTVSTGRDGKETPLGDFTILQKQVFHRSNLYSAAPMPWMQRLTWDGIALHAGHLPGYPASHGCIRLPKDFAKQLYEITGVGVPVSITEDFPQDPRIAPAGRQPQLRVDMAALGGERYERVVGGGDTASATMIDAVQRQPTSWVMGPAGEIVQPVPTNAH